MRPSAIEPHLRPPANPPPTGPIEKIKKKARIGKKAIIERPQRSGTRNLFGCIKQNPLRKVWEMTKGKNNTGNAKGKVAATQPTPEPEAPKGPAERLAAELARFSRSISMRADRTERWGDATIHHGKDKREILLGHEVRQRLKEASALINTGVDLLLEAPRGW
jgi:hypothetical protein